MTTAHMFVRRMLWRPPGGPVVPEPVIGLLGPHGAGKSTALRTISKECGSTIVHALLDFAEEFTADPIAAVGYVVFEFMRSWPNLRAEPTFHRVGLSLLALNEKLPTERTAARKRIETALKEYLVPTKAAQQAARAADVVITSARLAMDLTGIAATPQGQLVRTGSALAKPVIGRMLTLSGRLAVRDSVRWLRAQGEDTNLIDSLIQLSHRRDDSLDRLMDALLADLAENAAGWTAPVAKCECEPPEDVGDDHRDAWLLLVDHAGGGSGQAFLSALVNARQRRSSTAGGGRPAHDPLLVVAAVDQWTAAWGHWWREPWLTEPDAPARQRIPLLSRADMDRWVAHVSAAAEDDAPNPDRAWYPVWLDPLAKDEIGALAPVPGTWDRSTFHAFVGRLSGELPAAVDEIGQWYRAHPTADDVVTGVRCVFADHADDEQPLWEQALLATLPAGLLGRPLWRVIPDVVAVACHHLRMPGQPDEELDVTAFPEARRILRALRTNLWVSTFAARPSRLWPVVGADVRHPAVVHPWLVRCLVAGLAAESARAERRSGALTWHGLFAKLSDVDGSDPARCLYYQLAADQFDDVVDTLVKRFTTDGHRAWIRLLDAVTGAPCRWTELESAEESLARLVPEDAPGRTALQTAVANLVALLWLYRDPLTVQTDDLDKTISGNFLRLHGNDATRADASALEEAAKLFEPKHRYQPPPGSGA
ncbi:MAG TPA: hypothetical protein VJX10_01985 [Pseudonocardiaceae bacterium]|nr:hypothetical protein [Pseudonocardiaceae bacterium]